MAIELAQKHTCISKGGSLDEVHFRVVALFSRENGAARSGALRLSFWPTSFAGLHVSLIG